MEEEEAPESASVKLRRIEKGSHEWVLKNYSLHKGIGIKKPIKSDEFTVGGRRWTILLYPDGHTVDANNAGNVSLFLFYTSDSPVQLLYELYLIDQSGKGNHKGVPFGRKIHQLKFGLMTGRNHFINRAILESRDYLNDDCLKISCRIRVLSRQIQNLPPVEVPESNIGAHFGKLLESKESADVLFKVGDERFWGHKWILVCTSPVFRSRLSDCRECEEEIVIRDMEPRIFKTMLWFIYTGTLEEEGQTAVSFSSSLLLNSFMGKLLAAADQFELKKLKNLCESHMLEKLTAESVAYLLHLADLYHATELKAACLRFAAENHDAVLESDGCKYLKETCPSLFLELAYKKSPTSRGGELDLCIKILSAVKEPFVRLFSSQGASDVKQKTK